MDKKYINDEIERLLTIKKVKIEALKIAKVNIYSEANQNIKILLDSMQYTTLKGKKYAKPYKLFYTKLLNYKIKENLISNKQKFYDTAKSLYLYTQHLNLNLDLKNNIRSLYFSYVDSSTYIQSLNKTIKTLEKTIKGLQRSLKRC